MPDILDNHHFFEFQLEDRDGELSLLFPLSVCPVRRVNMLSSHLLWLASGIKDLKSGLPQVWQVERALCPYLSILERLARCRAADSWVELGFFPLEMYSMCNLRRTDF